MNGWFFMLNVTHFFVNPSNFFVGLYLLILRMTDLELAEQCLSGNRKAEKLLYERFSGQMFAVCKRYLPNQQEAEDVFHEAMIITFTKLKSWRKEGPLGGWIRRITVNQCINHLKKNKKMWTLETAELAQVRDASVDEILNPMNTADILKCIAELPLGYRTVFNLFAIEGFSHQEIAQQLGISESTSKTQFLKSKLRLQEKLAALEKKVST
mgnify:FL=1